MKQYIIILALTLIGFSSNSQQQYRYTVFDTIEQYPDKMLVHYKTYEDSVLLEESHAFLYPTTFKIPRFSILRRVFMTRVPADSIVYHGSCTTYLKNSYHKLEKYDKGELIFTEYYSPSGKEISETEYGKYKDSIGPCGIIKGHYFIYGKEKKNNEHIN